MQPSEAEEIVGLLRQMRVMAHVHPTGLQKSAIRVVQVAVDRRLQGRSSWLKVARDQSEDKGLEKA